MTAPATEKAAPIPALLPCPFCDNDGRLKEGHRDHWIVECVHCVATTGYYEARDGGKERAAAAWNRRADRASQEENPRPAKTGGLETAVLRQPQEERIREKADDTRLPLDVEWEERIREDERDALFLAAERAKRRHIRSWIGMRGGMFPADRARQRGDAS